MPINRPTWNRLVQRANLPGFPCPRCVTGKLKLGKNGLTSIEPKYILDWRRKNPDEWEFDFATERWSATMRCDENSCGEIVHLIGDIEAVETDIDLPDGETTWAYEDMLRIRAAFPAPPLFPVSENVPKKVNAQLEVAFRLYWTDASACVARLRTAVEMLLDDQKVPKQRLHKKGKSAGKLKRMDLHERIESFASGSSHKDHLQGLRNIGNLGTHGTEDVDDSDLFDAIDVIQFVLTGIYDTKTINAKAAKLQGKKAKP